MRSRIYKSKDGWRWSLSASNGNVLADSGQGYSRKIDCVRGLERVTSGSLLQMVKNDLQLLIIRINEAQAGHA